MHFHVLSLLCCRKATGLDKFLPAPIFENVKSKDIRKVLTHLMKSQQSLALPGQKHLTAMQTKMHYLKALSELRSFGGKCFLVTLEVSQCARTSFTCNKDLHKCIKFLYSYKDIV